MLEPVYGFGLSAYQQYKVSMILFTDHVIAKNHIL